MAEGSTVRQDGPRAKASRSKTADLLAALRAASDLVEHGRSPVANSEAAPAIAALEKAVEENPRSGLAYLDLGAALYNAGHIRSAYLVFVKAIEHDTSGTAYHNVGMMLREIGEYKYAVECLRKASKLNPKDADFYAGYGCALYETGRPAEAIDAFKKAIEVTPRIRKPQLLELFLGEVFGNFNLAATSRSAVSSVLAEPETITDVIETQEIANHGGSAYNERMAPERRASGPQPRSALYARLNDELFRELGWLDELEKPEALPENKTLDYNVEMNEAAKACAPAADYFGLPLEVVTETLAALRAKAAQETVTRERSAAPAPSATEGLQWPSEKWKRSPEELSRKRHAVVRFLRRVWKPFLDECGFPVTRAMVAERDLDLANAVTAYVRLNALPEDIRIVRTRDLTKMATREPAKAI